MIVITLTENKSYRISPTEYGKEFLIYPQTTFVDTNLLVVLLINFILQILI